MDNSRIFLWASLATLGMALIPDSLWTPLMDRIARFRSADAVEDEREEVDA